MDAKLALQRNLRGSGMEELLYPSRGQRDDIRRRGGTPKDHQMENYRNMKLKEIEAKKKKHLEEQRKQQKFPKPDKYAHIQSKIKQSSAKKTPTPDHASSVTEEMVPTAPSTKQISEKRLQDALPTSVAPSATSSRKSSVTEVKKTDRKTKTGHLPQYLIDRKQEIHRQAQEREAEEAIKATHRPGYRLLSEQERVQTLDGLKASQKDVCKALAALPLTKDTLRYRQQRRELEQRLRDMDRGIAMFEKRLVYVPE